MSEVQIKRRSGVLIYTSEKATDVAAALMEAVKANTNLYRADLSSADLSSADLSSADLSSADLSSADLYRADLSSADLSSADLYSANLSSADLYSANLYRANLSSAKLYRANLSSANLSSANLSSANLSSANLSSANLSKATIDGHICKGQFVQIFACAEWGALLAYISDKAELRVICGCRHMSIEEIEAHWKDRPGRKMSRVALAMVRAWHKEIASMES